MIRIALFLLFSLANAYFISAQSDYTMKPNDDKIEIDLMTSYYDQDGDNSPVTGGIGTEALTDIASMIVVNIPLDSTKSINFSGGIDAYTSASTDQIDNNVSSASRKDNRIYGNLGYTIKKLNRGETFGVSIGSSIEYDYFSLNGGIKYSKESKNGNREISFTGKAFIDQWTLYFPEELREQVQVNTKNRKSFNAQLVYSQVLSKRLQMSLSLEAIYMDGLLSTPFHRVYFSDNGLDIERLPSTRLKIPLGIRLNYFANDAFILRSYYRYYRDDFGIDAHTVSLEIPIKISNSFSIAPFGRFHTQTESQYFAAYGEHLSSQEFYTSDYDLSALSSYKVGMDIKFSPVYGISRVKMGKKKVLGFQSFNIRPSYYKRDNGLNAFSISLGLNFSLQ